ncbi:MAG: mannose-1-phosphate guanylyltransferase [Phycisphaerales bacterium]
MRYAMIMAGGAGTRLWPMSRLQQPKQLLPLIRRAGADGQVSAKSLLQISADRCDGLVAPERRFICTGEAYRAAIRQGLPEFTDGQILGEPAARDTVNAVGFTAAVLEKLDPEAIFAVFTADHVIEPLETFRTCVDLGFKLVEADPTRLVTFSIKPTYPATGFGYIERGAPMPLPAGVKATGLAYRVARFVEKPNIQKAQAYVESGMFTWNSGMFVWKAATVLDCIKRFKPECHAGLMKIQAAWGTKDQASVLTEVYPTLPRISVDYAIMEPASTDKKVSVATVLMDLKWLDVGSWPSYGETLPADKDGNRLGGVLTPERAPCVNSKGNLVVSSDPGHTVSLLGCENLIVVHTPDATLVMPRDKAEELKLLHGVVDARLK